MSNVLVTKYPFTMPEVGGTELLVIKIPTCVNLIDGCWLWNPSVGYLEVEESNDTDNIIVTNPGRLENAKPGTQFPSCMEFFVDAPTALPTYDPTVTCLAADFISPEVGETGIMVVDDTSHIRETDIIIIDRQYRYTVVEVLDEHRLLVRNEGDGKEGIIDIKCDECLSVKVLYSTFCCKVVREELQAEIDAINDRLDNKKSILPSNLNNLVSISGGANVQTDAPNDTVIYVDDDLSKYDNSVSKFITEADVPRGNLTVSSTDNVLTINSGSGTGALLKNANVNLDLSAYAKRSDIPAVGNGALTIRNSGGTTLGTFTANQSGNTTITIPSIPPIPTVPSVYSESTSFSEYKDNFTVNLFSPYTDGSEGTAQGSLNAYYTPVSISSSGVSGAAVTLFGTIVITCAGMYNSDTHTFNLHDEVSSASPYITLVTSRGPYIRLAASPHISTNGGSEVYIFNHPITTGRNYYYSLDDVKYQYGSTTASSKPFSLELTIPIIAEVTANATYRVSLDITVYGSGLRRQHQSGTGANYVNEPINVSVNTLISHTTLGWVIK